MSDTVSPKRKRKQKDETHDNSSAKKKKLTKRVKIEVVDLKTDSEVPPIIRKKLTTKDSVESGSKKKVKNEKKGKGKTTVKKGWPSPGVEKDVKEKSGPKVLKGGSKKVKSFDKTKHKFKPGVKRKAEEGEEGEQEEKEKKPKLEEMSKKERKEFRRKKALKSNYDLTKKTKSMWEELRRRDTETSRRAKICAELANIIRGRAKELIFAHDTCRVVQCLMQYGNDKQRTMVFEELKDVIPEMMKSKYSKFFIRKIMKYGTREQKTHVFAAFNGRVRKLIRHGEAAQILEYCYNDYANAVQRAMVVEEFYGPTFALFKTEKARTLEDILAAEPEKKDSILANLKEALLPLIDKNLLSYSLVHRMFHEYLQFCRPKARTEMIEQLRDQLAPMLHTRDGARVGMSAIWHGTAKDRKHIIKSLKGHVSKLCREEHGHLVLLAVFDAVDDTKLVQKAVLDELFKSVSEIGSDAHGRKVLHYLISRRDSKHFHPDIIKILEQGDGNANSKKDPALRARELLDYSLPRFMKFVETSAADMIGQNATALLLLEIITHATDDCTACLQAVSRVICEPYPDPDNSDNDDEKDEKTGTGDQTHVIDTAAGHICIRKLIMLDKERKAAGRKDLFTTALLDELEPGQMRPWIRSNRGCFTIVGLFETEFKSVQNRIRKELFQCENTLAECGTKGADILLKKLKS